MKKTKKNNIRRGQSLGEDGAVGLKEAKEDLLRISTDFIARCCVKAKFHYAS